MTIRYYIPGLIFCICSFNCFAQSMASVLNSKDEIKTKCIRLKKISADYKGKNQDSAFYAAKLADSLSRNTNDPAFISEMLSNYSAIAANSKKDVALNLAYENLDICKKSKDCKLISKAYLLIANVNYWVIGNNSKGFEYYESAIREAENCGDKKTLLEIYDKSQNIYFNTQKYEKNREILRKMEKVEPDLANDAWHNANYGDIFRNMKVLDSADHYYLKAIKIAADKKDTGSVIRLYFNYSLIPLERKDYKTAAGYCEKGLQMAGILKVNDLLISGNRQLYNIYFAANDLENAKKHLNVVIQLDEARNCIQCSIGNYRRMSELCSEQKNYKEAYAYLLKGIKLFEANNNSQTNSNITKVEEENLKRQKQLEIDLINKQKESEKKIKNILLVALSLAAVLILAIIFSLVKITKSRKLIALQQIETER